MTSLCLTLLIAMTLTVRNSSLEVSYKLRRNCYIYYRHYIQGQGDGQETVVPFALWCVLARVH